MTVKIIVDSACDISPTEAEKLGIIRLPLIVRFNQTEYEDGITLTNDEFYQKLSESEALPTTSQLTPAAFAKVFDEISAANDSAVVITVSAKLSGTYQSAVMAASDNTDIHVVDSANVCIGERILTELAVRLRDQALSAAQIAEKLNEAKQHICLYALLDTLVYLKKGGRISSTTAFAGELLSVKPLISVEDGEVKLIGKARGAKKGNRLLNSKIADSGGIDFEQPFSLAYSGISDERLNDYIHDSAELWSDVDHLPITTVGCVIGTHAGPDAIAVAFFRK